MVEFRGVDNSEFTTIWKAHIPLKVRIFLWLVKQNKVLTRVNLSKRGWNGDKSCLFCGLPETTNHLFVTCHFASVIWGWIANYNNFVFQFTTVGRVVDFRCIYTFERYVFVGVGKRSSFMDYYMVD